MNTPDFAICIFWKLRLLFVCTLKRASEKLEEEKGDIKSLKIIFLHDSFEIVSKRKKPYRNKQKSVLKSKITYL